MSLVKLTVVDSRIYKCHRSNSLLCNFKHKKLVVCEMSMSTTLINFVFLITMICVIHQALSNKLCFIHYNYSYYQDGMVHDEYCYSYHPGTCIIEVSNSFVASWLLCNLCGLSLLFYSPAYAMYLSTTVYAWPE